MSPRRPRHPVVLVSVLAALLLLPAGIVIAAHQFGDVPTSSPFHADIDALVDSGVTAGCGGGDYCPRSNVTREQMAAFLNRLGALSPDKTPVVNADRVDGYGASALTRVGYAVTDATVAIPDNPSEVTYGTVTLTAPAAGFVVVNATATIESSCSSGSCRVYGRLRHQGSGAVGQWAAVTAAEYETVSMTAVFAVSAGTNRFDIRLSRDASGNGTQSGYWGQLTASFSPFGSTGGSTLELPAIDPAAPPIRDE